METEMGAAEVTLHTPLKRGGGYSTRVELTLKIGDEKVKKKTAIAIDKLSMFIATIANFIDGLSLI